MCLFPFGNILIPPTDRARKLADYLRVAVGMHFFLAIFLIVGSRYLDGIFDILGALIGWMGIRSSEGYSFQCVLSYCVFCGMDIFWALLRIVLYFAGVSSTDTGSLAAWQYYIFVIGLVIAPFIYTFATVTAYFLYKELRLVVNESANQGDDGVMGGGGGYAQQQDARESSRSGAASSGSQWSHSEAHPAPQPGFKAFSGTGNRLGSN